MSGVLAGAGPGMPVGQRVRVSLRIPRRCLWQLWGSTVASDFLLVCSPGGVKLSHRLVVGPGVRSGREMAGGGTMAGLAAVGRLNRPIVKFTTASRKTMQWTWNALPWGSLPDLAMLTLTYPDKWQELCADWPVVRNHLARFRKRWYNAHGQALGVWALEFQDRGAPHFHVYVSLPPGVMGQLVEDDDEWQRLRWKWASDAWFEVVGSGDEKHRRRGVDVRPARYGGGKREKNVGDYFWRESGKAKQKTPPEGWTSIKWWATWGLKKVEYERQVSEEVYVAIRRPLRSLRRSKADGYRFKPSRGLDGLQVCNVDGLTVGVRLEKWAQEFVRGAAELPGEGR